MRVGDYLLIYRDRHVFYPLRHGRGQNGDGQIWTFADDEYDDAERMAAWVSSHTKREYRIASVISDDESLDRLSGGELPTLISDGETVYPVIIV